MSSTYKHSRPYSRTGEAVGRNVLSELVDVDGQAPAEDGSEANTGLGRPQQPALARVVAVVDLEAGGGRLDDDGGRSGGGTGGIVACRRMHLLGLARKLHVYMVIYHNLEPTGHNLVTSTGAYIIFSSITCLILTFKSFY